MHLLRQVVEPERLPDEPRQPRTGRSTGCSLLAVATAKYDSGVWSDSTQVVNCVTAAGCDRPKLFPVMNDQPVVPGSNSKLSILVLTQGPNPNDVQRVRQAFVNSVIARVQNLSAGM